MAQKPKAEQKHKVCIDFLEEHKGYFGLSDYKILFSIEPLVSDALAEADPNIFEKSLKINVTASFWTKDSKTQKNILLHELLHGRLSILDKWKEQITTDLEEDFVNDIVRGFERHKEL